MKVEENKITQKAYQWAKANKKSFAEKYIKESGAVPDKEEPACIFMAGLPGAGKTEYVRTIIRESGVKAVCIDMDDIASRIEGYKPQEADLFRLSATILQNEIFDRTKAKYYPFIMDGTLASDITINCIRKAINKGYRVKIVYIKQDPAVAWRNTKEREKIERRSINLDGFIDSYENTINNLEKVVSSLDVMIDIIIKDKHNKTIDFIQNATRSDIDKYVKIDYNNKQLRDSLDYE